jgi:hypothetical protein
VTRSSEPPNRLRLLLSWKFDEGAESPLVLFRFSQ